MSGRVKSAIITTLSYVLSFAAFPYVLYGFCWVSDQLFPRY